MICQIFRGLLRSDEMNDALLPNRLSFITQTRSASALTYRLCNSSAVQGIERACDFYSLLLSRPLLAQRNV